MSKQPRVRALQGNAARASARSTGGRAGADATSGHAKGVPAATAAGAKQTQLAAIPAVGISMPMLDVQGPGRHACTALLVAFVQWNLVDGIESAKSEEDSRPEI